MHDGQLINYNKIIDHWNIDEPAFELRTRKVLLKSNTLSQQDENEINKANLNALIKWKKLDIDDLYKCFFSSAKKSKSEVFNMYMEYFTRQYHDITDSPTNNPSSWNFNNWMRFFESFFEEEYKSKYPDAWCSTSIYRGMYPSLCVIFPLIKDHEFHANFEIVVRE